MEHWRVAQESVGIFTEYLIRLKTGEGRRPVFCVDYFDTVVTRVVDPEYTKVIASGLLSHFLGGGVSGGELYRMRRSLEAEIVSRNDSVSGEMEFSLSGFALEFYALLIAPLPRIMAKGPAAFVQTVLDIEVAVERAVQRVCPQMRQVLEALKGAGSQMILVSDFYLQESYFRKMLHSHGLEGVFDDIYVSVDYGISKGSGRLYEKISKDLGRAREDMVMIGDNEHADIKMAQENGLKTVLVSRPRQLQFYEDLRRGRVEDPDRVAVPFLSLKPIGDFAEMSSTLWLFCHRLFGELSQKGVRDVFFLSKEGEFLKRLFERYQQDLYGQSLIKSHYLLASRKATFLASLRSLEEEDFLRLLSHYRDISIPDFLRSLNFGSEQLEEICSRLGGTSLDPVVDLVGSQIFHELLELPLFRRHYEGRRLQQGSNFRQYLDSFGVDIRNEGLTIVDVGWKGSIQDNIYHILGQEVSVQGYFIGSFNPTELSEKNKKKGIIFENAPGESSFFRVYNSNRSLFEMILGASHGSADRYLSPEQYAAEGASAHLAVHSRVEGSSGEILVLALDYPEERSLYNTVISGLQDNIFRHFCTINQRYLEGGCAMPGEEWFARQHARMVFTPSGSEVELFANLYHLENFGIFGFTSFQSGDKMSLGGRLRNAVAVLRNPGLLESGIWPPIILRRLGLGFFQVLDGKRRYLREFSSLR